jgi:putative ABC transport system permease protein
MERETDGPRRHDEAKELIATMGVDGDPSEIPGTLALLEGRWPRRSNEVVLGMKLSHEKGLGIGDTIRLNARDFTVVGIGRLRGFGFSLDSIAYLDDRAFRDRADLGDVYNIIAVETAQPEQARQRIADLGSFTMSTAGELIKEAEETLAAELITYYVLDGLALAIGALFVSSMLSHAVSERRLEFATLRAIGIPTRTILLTVAAEATAVSIVAGVVGVGLSLLLGSWVNDYLAPSHDLEFLYSADARLFAQVFVLALALGLIAGLLPARAATRVDPVDVLREA